MFEEEFFLLLNCAFSNFQSMLVNCWLCFNSPQAKLGGQRELPLYCQSTTHNCGDDDDVAEHTPSLGVLE